MPKLNSLELKHKRKILNWAGENWMKLKESSKVRIWVAIYGKELPDKHELSGPDGGMIQLKVYLPENKAFS